VVSPERDENAPKIELSDRQLEHLMCISDVIVMLSHCAPPAGMFDQDSHCFGLLPGHGGGDTPRSFFWMTLVRTG
jgi:hypothetical protein